MNPSANTDREAFLALYDTALAHVFGYLSARCGSMTVAEDLTSETFLAAVRGLDREPPPDLSVAWLIGIARHKLIDYWRRREVEQRPRPYRPDADPDPWEVTIDAIRAHEVLATLGTHHRSALTLRYLDGLSVPQTAERLDRTVYATEALLVRARRAFRSAYERTDDGTRASS